MASQTKLRAAAKDNATVFTMRNTTQSLLPMQAFLKVLNFHFRNGERIS
jgi:hypothetical protein